MTLKYRSTSMKCECGKVHTYFGQDAEDILQMLDACNNKMFRHRYDVTTPSMMRPTVTCCEHPHLNWCEYDVREV